MYACAGENLLLVDASNGNTLLTCNLVMWGSISGAASTAESLNSTGVSLSEIVVPNVFTPGVDQINDVFSIGVSTGDCLVLNSLEIYDRWGVNVFSGPVSAEWNGSSKDENPCTAGTYYWIVRLRKEGEAEQFRSGFVTLIR